MAVTVDAGQGSMIDAPDVLSAIHRFYEKRAKPWIVYVKLGTETAAETDLADFMEVLFQFQYYRVLHMDAGHWLPSWFVTQTDGRPLHTRVDITDTPWLRWQATELIYHWTDADSFKEPDLPNNPANTANYLNPVEAVSQDAIDHWMQESEHPWGLWFPSTVAATKLELPHV